MNNIDFEISFTTEDQGSFVANTMTNDAEIIINMIKEALKHGEADINVYGENLKYIAGYKLIKVHTPKK